MTAARTISLVMVLTTGGVMPGANAGSTAMPDWQTRRVFEPTQHELTWEEKGRVMIYDGLTDRQVARAFDEQFDRLGHMMFTRIVVTDDSGEAKRNESGEPLTESDDGCD